MPAYRPGRERGRSGGTAGGLGGASGGGETELQLQKRRIGVRLKALKRKLDEVTHPACLTRKHTMWRGAMA